MIYLAGYVAPGRLTDKLTRFFTGSPVSHVELTDGRWWLAASWRDGGVRTKKIEEVPGHWIKVPMADGETVWHFMEQYIGARYDLIGAITGPTTGLNLGRCEDWFCSEIMAGGQGHPKPWTVSPGAIMDGLQSRFSESASDLAKTPDMG
ncbi:MAG: hypothetical protein ABJG14_11035 [Sulfitobacter sp.]|uniref:hypothetical protein n=1 Tax=Alphaproteobacteria TaxID=28211 RepID=UPI0032654111